MSLQEFDKTFGLITSLEEEKERFINRIENTIFMGLISMNSNEEYRILFNKVCYQLGEDATEIIRDNSFLRSQTPNFKILTKKDFIQTLRVLVAIFNCESENLNVQEGITKVINESIEKSNINLGIKWNEGIFYPTGDKFLDQELVDHSLTLLDKYPNEKIDLRNALENYYAKSLYGVVENCYLATEGIARGLLKNRKTLDKNKEDLLRHLDFSNYWNNIIANFLSYAHEYRRHAGEDRHSLKHEEVEGFLYLTCLLIRSIIKANVRV